VHEYSVIGHPRERIIFIIAFISIIVGPIVISILGEIYSSLTGQVFSLSIAVMSIFSGLYFLFNKWFWKIRLFSKIFSFPNLNGTWVCSGETLDTSGSIKYQWSGQIRIEQSWDKLLITLVTENSKSSSLSVVGGIRYIPTIGYKLSYSYENDPNIGEVDLKKHEGFCELVFSENLESSSGHYFNGANRFTFGRINLIKD